MISKKNNVDDTITSMTTTTTTSTPHKQHHELPPFLSPAMYVIVSIQVVLATALAIGYRVPISDVMFCITYSVYLLLSNFIVFGPSSIKQQTNIQIDDGCIKMKKPIELLPDGDLHKPWFRWYMLFYTCIGLIFPILLLMTLLLVPRNHHNDDDNNNDENDHDKNNSSLAIAAASPLFVLWCRIIMEGIVLPNVRCHTVIRLAVPIGFCAYQLMTIIPWLVTCWNEYNDIMEAAAYDRHQNNGSTSTTTIVSVVYSSSSLPSFVSLCLAFINLIAFGFNLFVFMPFRMVPHLLIDTKQATNNDGKMTTTTTTMTTTPTITSTGN